MTNASRCSDACFGLAASSARETDSHPGFEVDLEVAVDTTTLYFVYLGQAELGGAIRAGKLTMSGPRTLQRGIGPWFTWSAFAPARRLAEERRTLASRLAGAQRVRIAE